MSDQNAGAAPAPQRIESERVGPLTELYAYVVQIGEGETGVEGVLRRRTPIGTQPLVGDCPQFMEQLKPVALEALQGMRSVQSLKLVRFARSEETVIEVPASQPQYEELSPYDDANVKAALKAGRDPSDIYLLDCPQCGNAGYYNQGSHFTCHVCGAGYRCITEEEVAEPDSGPCIVLGEEYTLADFEESYDCD